MSVKFSIGKIGKRHFSSLGSDGDGRQIVLDIAWFFVIPILVGFDFGLYGFSLRNASMAFVTAISILAALMCAMAVMVFQLRTQVNYHDDPLVPPAQRDLLDETFYNILWAIIVGLTMAVCVVVGDVFCWFENISVLPEILLSSFVIALSVHFVLTVFMVLKRLSRAYEVIGMHLG